MTEPEIFFDVLDRSTGLGAVIFKLLCGIGFPSLLLFFAVRGLRKALTKSKIAVMAALGVVAAIFFLAGIGSFVTDPAATKYRQQIESHDYKVVRGKIINLTASTLLAGNPVATFEVADHVFEYGRGSDNYELDMVEKNGVLVNGLSVEVWFKDDKILRILAISDERK